MTELKQKIRMLVMDADGTLTDGSLFYGPDGHCFCVYNVKDGYGIRHLLPQRQIMPAIITGRSSAALRHRAGDLGITLLYQGVTDKVSCLRRLAREQGLSTEQIAYIGDDLNDLECMRICGLSGCPADAADQVKQVCSFVSRHNGGDGAVRDFIEWLCAIEGDC